MKSLNLNIFDMCCSFWNSFVVFYNTQRLAQKVPKGQTKLRIKSKNE